MLRQQGVLGGFAARYLLAEHQRVAVGQDGESTEVENLVVHRAQGQAVFFDVRTAGLEPFDMGSFQADGLLT